MSKLADFGVPYTTVSTSNGPLSVRGLSLADLTSLAGRYGPTLFKLYETFPAPVGDELIIDYLKRPAVVDYMKTGLAEGMLTTAPGLVAEVIACGADGLDDPESVSLAARLPVGIQLDLTSAIIVATVAGFSGVGKMKEVVGPIVAEALAAAKLGSRKA